MKSADATLGERSPEFVRPVRMRLQPSHAGLLNVFQENPRILSIPYLRVEDPALTLSMNSMPWRVEWSMSVVWAGGAVALRQERRRDALA